MTGNGNESRFVIRSAESRDERDWRGLWLAYNEFYGTALPEAVTDITWHRIIDPQFPIHAIISVEDAKLIGFANYAVQPYTWGIRPHCYLEDLFVPPKCRGKGVGGALIDHLVQLCRTEGWTELYWLTQENNETARRLYDKITPWDGYIQYTVELEGNNHA